ncbi:hypothetical protein L7F22_004540 [Adiantum nelumboides]|nr:hypothetical protein [Adiantum nelumboides]
MQFETVLQAEWFFETVKQLVDHHKRALEGTCNANNRPTNLGLEADNCKPYPLGTESAHSGHVVSMITLHEALRSRSSTFSMEVLPLAELSVNASSSNEKSTPVVLPPRFPQLGLQQHQFQTYKSSFEQNQGKNLSVVAEDLKKEQSLKEKLKILSIGLRGFGIAWKKSWQLNYHQFHREAS